MKKQKIKPINLAILLLSKGENALWYASSFTRLLSFVVDILFSFPILYFAATIFKRYYLYQLNLDVQLAWYDAFSIIFASDFFILSAFILTLLITYSLYRFLLLSLFNATLGMMFFKLVFVNSKLNKPSPLIYILREIFSLLSFFLLLSGYLWAIFDDAHRTWHDKVLGLYIIKRENH